MSLDLAPCTNIHSILNHRFAPRRFAQLAQTMATSSPDEAELLRVGSRDMWRLTLSSAFNLDLYPNNDGVILGRGEMNIVQARELMHSVSQSMSSADFLEEISQQVGSLSDVIQKHTAIQTLLLSSVYLNPEDNLCKAFDDDDELGYVKMQCLLAEVRSSEERNNELGMRQIRS